MGFLSLWITLFLIWLVANTSLDGQVLITGVLVATVVTILFGPFARVFKDLRFSGRILWYYLLYVGVFLQELLRANLNVARIVLSPRIDIKPGIVEIKTNLKSPMGRLVLANSITLTPGTLVVDIQGDSLFIHWIDVTAHDMEEATRQIASRFEHYLTVIYG